MKKKSGDISGTVGLKNSKVKISKLNYNKKLGEESKVEFNASFTNIVPSE